MEHFARQPFEPGVAGARPGRRVALAPPGALVHVLQVPRGSGRELHHLHETGVEDTVAVGVVTRRGILVAPV